MKRHYMMGLIIGLCFGAFSQGYGMEADSPTKGLHGFLVGYDRSRDAGNLKNFFNYGTDVIWNNAIENIKTFVQNNYKNAIGITDKNLSSALNGFLTTSAEYYGLAKLRLLASMTFRERLAMNENLSNMLDYLEGTQMLLSTKHITKSKEEARQVLRDAVNILKSLIEELKTAF